MEVQICRHETCQCLLEGSSTYVRLRVLGLNHEHLAKIVQSSGSRACGFQNLALHTTLLKLTEWCHTLCPALDLGLRPLTVTSDKHSATRKNACHYYRQSQNSE